MLSPDIENAMNTQIAAELFLSEKTIESHLRNIFFKLGAGSRVDVARAFAAEAGLDITVCHLPPGTSKWNRIEHRLFSAISRNWRGRPLESHEVVIETLRATTTSTGLTVNAVLDTTTYDRGIKITDKQIAALEATQLHRHEFHGDWNYTLTANHTPTRPTPPT